MEQSRGVTVGLVPRHWLHHPHQLPPVIGTESALIQAEDVTSDLQESNNACLQCVNSITIFDCNHIRPGNFH